MYFKKLASLLLASTLVGTMPCSPTQAVTGGQAIEYFLSSLGGGIGTLALFFPFFLHESASINVDKARAKFNQARKEENKRQQDELALRQAARSSSTPSSPVLQRPPTDASRNDTGGTKPDHPDYSAFGWENQLPTPPHSNAHQTVQDQIGGSVINICSGHQTNFLISRESAHQYLPSASSFCDYNPKVVHYKGDLVQEFKKTNTYKKLQEAQNWHVESALEIEKSLKNQLAASSSSVKKANRRLKMAPSECEIISSKPASSVCPSSQKKNPSQAALQQQSKVEERIDQFAKGPQMGSQTGAKNPPSGQVSQQTCQRKLLPVVVVQDESDEEKKGEKRKYIVLEDSDSDSDDGCP